MNVRRIWAQRLTALALVLFAACDRTAVEASPGIPPVRSWSARLLGLPTGMPSGWAAHVNDQGTVVGGVSVGPSSVPYMWTAAGGFSRLPTGSIPYGSASAINSSGLITGHLHDLGPRHRMAIWLDGGTRLHLIPGLDSTTNAHVYAINDLGEVTGTGWVRGSTPGFVAYRYSMSGGLEILRPLVQDPLATDFLSARSSAGVAINNAGVVVGWASDSTGVQPVLWRRNNLPVPLGRMPGASRTFVVAINDAGTAVGYELQDGVNTSRPIVWRAVGSPELLPMPFGVTSAWAAAIDGRGRIYGASRSGPIVWLEDGTFAELPLFPMFTQPQPLGVSPCGKVAAMADRWVVWDRIC